MNLEAFKKKMKEDSSFRAKFADCKTPDDLVAAAAKEGYTFTVADISAAVELSPEVLQKVAGGSWIGTEDWFVGPSAIITRN